MKRHHYIYDAEIWNDELLDWWEAIEAVHKTHMAKLHGAGVLEDLPVNENDPTPDMNVLVGAGYAWDGYGAIIHPTATETVDCSVDKDSNPTIPSSGKERIIVIAAMHDRKLSGLETSIKGWPEAASEEVYTVDEDWYKYVVIAGAEADPGNAVAPSCAVGEIHLAQVTLASSTTQITDAMIDTSNRPEITNPADAIAEHVVADPAHAADKISYSNTTSGLTADDVQAAIDEVEGRVDDAESDMGDKDEFTWLSSAQTVVNAGTASTFTDVDVSAYVPTGTKAVLLHVAQSTEGQTHVKHPSGAEVAVGDGSTANQEMFVMVGIDSNREFQYKIVTSFSSTTTIKLVGYIA